MLPAEILFCGENEVIEIEAEEGVSYVRNTEEEGDVIEITEAGTYSVTATSVDDCETVATVNVLEGVTPDITIEGPESLCPDSTGVLSAGSEAPGSFLWSTGESGSEIVVDESGIYSVSFFRDVGCSAEEVVEINEAGLPIIFATDTAICEGDEVTIFATVFNGTASWPGISQGSTAVVDEPGIYEVVAENQCGSTAFEVEIESVDCSCPAYVPNVFTPNGDGLNDLFIPLISCGPEQYELLIFNRWGNEVFSSNDPNRHWNGDSNGNSNYFSSDGV